MYYVHKTSLLHPYNHLNRFNLILGIETPQNSLYIIWYSLIINDANKFKYVSNVAVYYSLKKKSRVKTLNFINRICFPLPHQFTCHLYYIDPPLEWMAATASCHVISHLVPLLHINWCCVYSCTYINVIRWDWNANHTGHFL